MLGIVYCRSTKSSTDCCSICSPEIAVTASGASWTDSSFLRAVTVIDSIVPRRGSCARAGSEAAAANRNEIRNATRRFPDMAFLPL
jgi:hypothetical protein